MVGENFPGTIPAGWGPVISGATVVAMIYTVGHVSGAHLNPAITLAFTATRHFSLRQLPYYWLAQFAGSIAAITLLSSLIPASTVFGATVLAVNFTTGFIWEVVLSFFMMLVIIAVATDTKAEGVMAGIAVGTIVALCAFIGGAFTGASMNPVRSLAPAIFQGTLNGIWIYMVAPCVGTVLGALFYQAIRHE